MSTVQPLGHYYPRAITHTRAGASVDTQHRIAVHFITPTPNTHTNLEVLPWVMVSPEYRRAAVHMRTRAQLDTRSAAAATSHHTHRAGLPNAVRPSVSQYVSDGRDCRLAGHMHMRSPAERRGGRGRERKGRSHALAEEDGRERVVLADWRHVGRGLVGGVAKFVPLHI